MMAGPALLILRSLAPAVQLMCTASSKSLSRRCREVFADVRSNRRRLSAAKAAEEEAGGGEEPAARLWGNHLLMVLDEGGKSTALQQELRQELAKVRTERGSPPVLINECDHPIVALEDGAYLCLDSVRATHAQLRYVRPQVCHQVAVTWHSGSGAAVVAAAFGVVSLPAIVYQPPNCAEREKPRDDCR